MNNIPRYFLGVIAEDFSNCVKSIVDSGNRICGGDPDWVIFRDSLLQSRNRLDFAAGGLNDEDEVIAVCGVCDGTKKKKA